jgi:hypothetical protein
LGLDFDLVGLHLLEIKLAVSYQVAMQLFTLLTGSLPPFAHGALINLHSSHNALHWAAINY